jgi:predicted DNA-binding transcriptional regulator
LRGLLSIKWAAGQLGSRVGSEEDYSENDLISFVQAAVGSVCALELLIYLRRERDKSFRADELVREMRSSELAVGQALDGLMQSGLVVEIPQVGYRYQQSSAQLDLICQRLETEYARKPVTIIRTILAAPNEKLRIFADAFRFSGKRE